MNPDSLRAKSRSHATSIICFLLTVATLLGYWQARHFDFVNIDDPVMLLQNPMVTGGLSSENIWWGMTASYFEYWHPITWWSHMLDFQLFGFNAGRHHLVSVAFHIANTLLLFGMLRQLTRFTLRSAIVAALFALHPMHVESVAWIAERKELLGVFFWLLSVWSYANYVRQLNHNHAKTELFYRLSLFFFFCGIMSKPMVVTLPFVLLLLDYWPLNRWTMISPDDKEPAKPALIPQLLYEKIPFFGLSLLSGVITFSNVKSAHNIISSAALPWSYRLANVPLSYGRYLWKLVWPTDMSAFYPMAKHLSVWQVTASILALALITLVMIIRLRPSPYLVFGWLMFLGTLVPTISLVPVGFQAIADRYTYLAYIGLFVIIVWGMGELSAHWKFRFPLLTVLTSLALIACGGVTSIQAAYWRNSFTLWPHCLAVTRDNTFAEYNYAFALQNANRPTEAIPLYREVLRIKPEHLNANLNLGRTYAALGRFQEATNSFARALRLQPNSADAHGNMGAALFELGDFNGAIAECSESLRLDPQDLRSMLGLARSLGAAGKSDEALAYYSQLLRFIPNSAEVYYHLGLELLKRKDFDGAVSSLSRAVKLDPSLADAAAQLSLALSKRAGNDAPH